MTLIKGVNIELMQENSKKNTDIAATQRDYIAGISSKDIACRLLLAPEIVEAHNKWVIHFHDLDYFIQPIFNCCLIDIKDMHDNGTVMNNKLIEPPRSFQVACTVTPQIITCIASNQYGGQSMNMKHLGKYLRMSKARITEMVEEALGENSDVKAKEAMVNKLLKKELSAEVQTIQYQINTLYSTPAESLCYSLTEKDLNQFGSIPDIPEKNYYTNSYHVDVREEIDAISKLLFESEFQSLALGGCMSYVKLPNMNHNPMALEAMISVI